jgi:hypothetical protein
MRRPDFRFAGIVAGLMTVAMVWVALDQHLPMRDPDGFEVPTYIRLPLLVVGAVVLDIVPRAFVRTGRSWRSLPRTIVTVTRERWHRRHLWFATSGLLTWYVCYATFRNLKSYVPFVNDRLWDPELASVDRTLWLGHDPADVLHSWFGTGVAAHFFSFIYVAWIVLVPVSLAVALVWTRHQAAGSWFVTAVALDWLLGVATYFALPSLGPVYSAPSHFSDLPSTFVGHLQTVMIDDRMTVLAHPTATYPVQSIAAFASLHVGIMVTMCLVAEFIGLPRWLRVSAWVLLALTVLCTVYLGWHFFADTLGGAVIGSLAVWIAAWATGNWARGRPRLVPREDVVQPRAERIRPA